MDNCSYAYLFFLGLPCDKNTINAVYVHIRCQVDEDETPSTPKSTAKAITETINAATPRTTALLESQKDKEIKRESCGCQYHQGDYAVN